MAKNLVKGLLFGTAVGGVLAALTAQKSGQEMRQNISDEVLGTKNTFVKLITDAKAVKSSSEEVKAELSQFNVVKNDTTKIIDDFKFQSEPRVQEINTQVSKIKKRISDLQDTIKKEV